MKKSTNSLKMLMALILCSAISFISCQKENDNIDDSSDVEATATKQAIQDDADTEADFDDVFNISMGVNSTDVGEDIGLAEGIGLYGKIAATGDGNKTASPDSNRCFTVTVTPMTVGVFPKTVTTDFGTGCLGRDGKLRKGKIVTVYTGPMFVPGKKATTTFINYHVDSFKIEGTHIIENTSTQTQAGWSVKVIDGKVTNTISNRWRKWDGERNVLQVEGNLTPRLPADDVFKITGNAHGSNSQGYSWSTVITDPLIKRFTCRWLVKGVVTITRNGNVAVLNYGNGNCDNQAVITINGVSHTINLH